MAAGNGVVGSGGGAGGGGMVLEFGSEVCVRG
jgi:hypothetical protein